MPRLRVSIETARALTFACDLVILASAAMLAALQEGLLHWKVGLGMAAVAWAFWVSASRLTRQYDVDHALDLREDFARTALVLTAVSIPLAVLREVSQRYAVTTELERFLAVAVPALLCVRLLAAAASRRDRPVEQIVVVGVGPLGRLTQRELRDAGEHRAVAGHLRFDDEQPDERLDAPVLGMVADLEKVLKERAIHEVYVASTAPQHVDAVQSVVRSCEQFGVPFALPVGRYRFSRAVPACERAVRDGYVHYLSVRPKPVQRAFKRLLDLAVSAAALVLLAPLLVVTAIAVRLTSRGPVFYRQERVGMHGRRFQMLKFRSMVVDADDRRASLAAKNERTGPVFKIALDPRVTRVGRVLRKYSIDELPQIVNVLRGDMSLVGPRPALPGEVAKYEGWQRRRLSVRPGLTCVWQVSGRDRISFATWMFLDMRYIDHWSLWEDVRLIFRTLPVVLLGRGAS
jgi:exopolysaccharide biosynthesis polyprenyl glycosylphosphotransferase